MEILIAIALLILFVLGVLVDFSRVSGFFKSGG